MENKIKPEYEDIQDLVLGLFLDLLGYICVSWTSFQFTSIENRSLILLLDTVCLFDSSE